MKDVMQIDANYSERIMREFTEVRTQLGEQMNELVSLNARARDQINFFISRQNSEYPNSEEGRMLTNGLRQTTANASYLLELQSEYIRLLDMPLTTAEGRQHVFIFGDRLSSLARTIGRRSFNPYVRLPEELIALSHEGPERATNSQNVGITVDQPPQSNYGVSYNELFQSVFSNTDATNEEDLAFESSKL